MKNTDTNFNIEERVRKSIFIDRGGDWTSFTNGQGSMAEQLGAFILEFLVFVEIYNLDGELIINFRAAEPRGIKRKDSVALFLLLRLDF